ncbi:MAG: ATPase [Treponema sp.]|jgi:hypothetical protein|nr:ATPase [Treponema sp.]
MEELRSTEVLDREILEDARKKAFKILKTADDTVRSQAQRWEKKTRKAVADIRGIYARRVEKVKEEILARLPLDKRRLRSETAEHFLLEAMENFLATLSRKQLLSVLDREFTERLADCPGLESKAVLLYSGMTGEEAGGIVKNREWELRHDESPGRSKFPALVLNAPSVRVIASVEKAAMELLEDKRAELAACLLSQGVLND